QIHPVVPVAQTQLLLQKQSCKKALHTGIYRKAKGQRNLFSQQPHPVSEDPVGTGIQLGESEHFEMSSQVPEAAAVKEITVVRVCLTDNPVDPGRDRVLVIHGERVAPTNG